MKQHIKTSQQDLTYNDCVQLAYFQVLKQVKQMLATIEQDELRCTLERVDQFDPVKQGIVHELVNPLIYLRLETINDQMTIHFGIEQLNQHGQLSELTTRFLRFLYKVTMKDAYPIDIEDCVRTDWFLKNNCSEAYEYIEERNRHHTFRKIRYKPAKEKRKLMLSVA